jgi:transglutaminase-like putative cysteine protease
MKNLKSLLSCLPLAAAALALASPGRSEEAGPYSGDEWAALDLKQVEAEAADVNLAKLPDCDEATVDQRSMRVVHGDGTAEIQDEVFTKVLTEKGRRDNNTLTMNFMLPYSTVGVPRLEIIKPDGRVEPVDVAANSKESIDDSQMQMNIYDPNSKVLRVNIPKVEIGDMVHAVMRTTVTRPFIPGEYAEDFMMEGGGYIRHLSLELRMPADKPLRQVILRDEIPGTVAASTRTEGGSVAYHWEVSRVPRMFDEPAMPPYQEVLQRVSLSTTPDWGVVSRWYWELSKPHLNAITPEMKKQVADLTAGAATDMDRIRAVFYYVSKKIRYMGITPEKDRPGFEPHDVEITYGKKYGVCRDKAALLVSLLRAAGENAYPVLVSVGWKKDPRVPNPYFNHAIVGVELRKGEYVLMDPTDENTRDLLPTYDDNQSYLACRPEGDVLRLSPVDPPENSMMRITTTGTLSASGALEAHSEMSFDGINDNEYRQAFAQMKPDDRRRFFEANIKHAMPGATLKSLRITPENILDTSVPVRAVVDFSAATTTAFGEGKAVVNVPWIGKDLGIVNFILGGTGLEKRRFPMETYVACGLHEEVSLRLAPGFTGTVSMPTCAPQDDECVGYQRAFLFRDGILSCSRDVRLKTVEFTPAQYLRLKQTLKELQNDDRKSPVLATTYRPGDLLAARADAGAAPPVESDSRVLEERVELQVKDAHTALLRVRVVKEILNYSGKKRESEIKIDYNPAISDARLVKAVVTSKDGKRQEISKEEVNVMDAGWNAGAKRYTGGRILVANLPGVDVGSTIEVEYEIAYHGKAYVSGFQPFQEGDELARKDFVVTVPAGVDLRTLDCGPAGIVSGDSRVENGFRVMTWKAANVKAMPAEHELPPAWLYRAGVAYYVGDPAAYLAELERTLLDRSAHSARAQELARKLAAGAKTKLDAVKAIRNLVTSAIRSAGPSFTALPLGELSNADTTLSDGYGHGADCAILLHAMLSAAGLKPEFVLASPEPAIDPLRKVAAAFPLPYEFQSVLVRVRAGSESYYCNDTDQYARLGATPHDGDLGITLADQSLGTIRAARGDENRLAESYRMSVDDAGRVRMQIRREYFGTGYGEKNKFFSELPPEERRRYFQEAVSGVAQGARPVGDLSTNFDGYPGVEQFTVEIDHYAVVDGKYLYFDLPYALRLFPANTDRHTLPLLIRAPLLETVHAQIELPAGFRRVVIAPRNEDMTAPDGAGTVHVSARASGTGWSVTQELSAKPSLVAPQDYGALLSVESALENESSRLLLLEH